MNQTNLPEDHETDGETRLGVMAIFREWGDALVIAFVLAMFVRIFLFELFKIPTGSMTPTLLGDLICEVDLNDDGRKDLIVRGAGHQTLIFMDRGDRLEYDGDMTRNRADLADRLFEEGRFEPEYDRIFVNKFSYWFHHPERGDVVVFKVPDEIWDPAKPIYIKRCVGEPGDRISFKGRLKLNGKPVENPEFFRNQEYVNEANKTARGFVHDLKYVEQHNTRYPITEIDEVRVPEDGMYVLGDNTHSSLDSRYWGCVPLENVKGRAFMRYWPLRKLKFIR